MLIKRRAGGFSLFELLVVLSFLSAMLIFSIQVSTSTQQNSRVQLFVAELSDLKNAVYAASGYIKHEVTPADLVTEQLYFGELYSPWGEPYRIEYTELGIYVLGYARTQKLAERLVKQLSAAEYSGGWVKLFVHQPEPKIDDSLYLHREFDAERPHLNQMNTDLDMSGHNILNVGDINADKAEFAHVSVPTALLSHVESTTATIDNVSAINIATASASLNAVYSDIFSVSELLVGELFAETLSVSAPLVKVESLQVSQLQGAQLTTEALSVANHLSVTGSLQTINAHVNSLTANEITAQEGNFGSLTAQQLTSEALFANNLNANVVTASQLHVAGSFQVSELIANTIFASDFVTATSSLVAVQTLAAKVESLWLQCTYDGGCR